MKMLTLLLSLLKRGARNCVEMKGRQMRTVPETIISKDVMALTSAISQPNVTEAHWTKMTFMLRPRTTRKYVKSVMRESAEE